MAESSLAVTPGTGLNLRTNTRTVSGTVHEQAVTLAEGNQLTYTAGARNVSLLTATSHLMVLQADGTNYLRIKRISIQQVTGTASGTGPADIQIFRSTTAGTTYGTTITPVALDNADAAYAGVCGSLPGVKGTLASNPLLQARLPLAGSASNAISNGQRWEWKAREDGAKAIVTGNGTTSGIVVYLVTGFAATAPTVDIEIEFTATTYI